MKYSINSYAFRVPGTNVKLIASANCDSSVIKYSIINGTKTFTTVVVIYILAYVIIHIHIRAGKIYIHPTGMQRQRHR